jgi:hypothetical protein
MTPLSDFGFALRKWFGRVLDQENSSKEQPKSVENFVVDSRAPRLIKIHLNPGGRKGAIELAACFYFPRVHGNT